MAKLPLSLAAFGRYREPMSWRQLQALILLTITFLVSAGSLSAKFDSGVKTASRDFWEPISESVREIGPQTPENTVGNCLYVYDLALGRPLWTYFDPLGLYETAAGRSGYDRAAQYASEISGNPLTWWKVAPMVWSGVSGVNAELPGQVDNARKEINNSRLPAPAKVVAKAALATGSAGHSVNPLVAAEETVQLANTVREQGVAKTAKAIVDEGAKLAQEDIAYLGMAIVTGVAISKKGPKKPSLSAHKKALAEVHAEVGKLPKGKPGKFGSPQRGDKYKGYRLDEAHPPSDIHPPGSPGTKPHIDWWDRPSGKRKGPDSRGGKIPIEDED